MDGKKMFRSRVSGLVAALALWSAPLAALAAEPIVIYSDQSQIITVSRQPATVVVGNPSIADVTIQGQQVFLHARSYGTTNIIILDDAGKQIADYEVTVMLGGSNNLAVFKAGNQYTYVCAPDCEVSLHVGDDLDWFNKLVAGEVKTKNSLAMGQKGGEVAAPAPPPSQ
ncbi:MAG: hypothetical protein FJX63_01450 [Alphaproteobacteria bacterium]|nr:hypothetical protein [Alphaproteobacteria bacterium]